MWIKIGHLLSSLRPNLIKISSVISKATFSDTLLRRKVWCKYISQIHCGLVSKFGNHLDILMEKLK
jgi:hypothetical protein